MSLTPEEIARGLIAQGVPRAVAEREAQRQTRGVRSVGPDTSTTVHVRFEPPPSPAPITLRIPWSALVSDNDKYSVSRGQMFLTETYRAAKKAITSAARDAMGDTPCLSVPLALVARVWMPNNRPHDLTNFCKVVHDGLEHVVYQNDAMLHDVRWIRAGVDVDAPRCELTITPL